MNKVKLIILSIVCCIGFLGCSSSQKSSLHTLSFATEATYAPFEMVSPSGKLQGFDIDVATAICKTLKVKCVFINQPFDSLIPGLTQGKFDAIIAAMNITEERAKVVDFSREYYKSTVSFVAGNSTNFTIDTAGLKGKIIGVQQGTTLQQYLKATYGSDVTIKTYASIQSAFVDMDSGRINTVMGDTPLMQQWLTEHGNGKYHFVGKPISDPVYFGAGYGIAVKKGNQHILDEINKAIIMLHKDGQLDEIEAKYFPK